VICDTDTEIMGAPLWKSGVNEWPRAQGAGLIQVWSDLITLEYSTSYSLAALALSCVPAAGGSPAQSLHAPPSPQVWGEASALNVDSDVERESERANALRAVLWMHKHNPNAFIP
jgi:hypothetical protein